MLTRRHFLAATAAAGLAPCPIWASSSLTLGALQIDTLSDGNLVLPGNFILGGMPQAEMEEIVARYGLPTDQLTPPCNVTLVRDGTNTILFDVGAGPDFQPSAGKLAEALSAVGVSAEDVTHVVFTHAHPDHLWGVLDDFDDPVFANAEYLIGEAEHRYWTDPNTVSTIGEARATFAIGAERRLAAIAESLRVVQDDEEILPGIAARLTPGHTPGHMAFEIRAGSDAVMVVGDALGNHHVAFEQPDWASGSDQDKDIAAQTRRELLDQVSASKMLVIGYHLPGAGIGYAEKAGSGYRFVAR